MTHEDQLRLDLPEQPTIDSLHAQLVELTAMLNEVREKQDNGLATNRLWSLNEIAKYIGCTVDNARRIMKNPGAPQPIRVPTSPGHRLPARYNSEEVLVYIQRIHGADKQKAKRLASR